MNIRSCELQTHLYAIAPHHCTKDKDESGKKKRTHQTSLFNLTISFLFNRI
jgi:hypothetical protein